MQKTEFVFPIEQRTQGCCLVCPCCNEMIANGAAFSMRANQKVHDHCAARFDLVMKMKPEIELVLGAVPQKVLEGTDLHAKLSRAFTIAGVRKILMDLCRAIKESEEWLKEQFSELVHAVTEKLIPIGQRVQVGPQQITKYLTA